MRRGRGYNNFEQFRDEVLRGYSGPLNSAVEDIADEMYQASFDAAEGDSLFDAVDDDE